LSASTFLSKHNEFVERMSDDADRTSKTQSLQVLGCG
jgi:hypothetical protein